MAMRVEFTERQSTEVTVAISEKQTWGCFGLQMPS